MSSIRLHRQVCAFIDVLGGANLFQGKDRKRAAAFFACLGEFERRLNGWSRHFPKKRQASSLVKTFSDNIFVAFPFGSSSKMSDQKVVETFLDELTHQIQELTLFADFPVRGAVSVGPLMFTDKFLFGPALVEAVQLEKEALFPRVLLSKSVLKYISPESPAAKLVLRDSDGKSFLHYLPKSKVWLDRHQNYVRNGLLENASRVHERQKYEWLVQYHNFVTASAGLPEYEISSEYPDRFVMFQQPLPLEAHA
ncbi:MAG: hypothetical protein WAZ34_04995 [Rhodocyclaceae bacterium]